MKKLNDKKHDFSKLILSTAIAERSILSAITSGSKGLPTMIRINPT